MTNQAELYQRLGTGQHDAGIELINILDPQPGDKVLDIGSGTGNLTVELAKRVQANGQVLAIEPDVERLAIAKENCPPAIQNIDWYAGDLASAAANKLTQQYERAFSNYVLHWIEDQQEAVKQVYDALLPGGVFAFCCVFSVPQVVRELCVAADIEKKMFSTLHLTDENSWLDYFKEAGFRIQQTYSVPNYHYKDVGQLMMWWQATSHGIFCKDNLTAQQIDEFYQRYPGDLYLHEEDTLCLLAVKD